MNDAARRRARTSRAVLPSRTRPPAPVPTAPGFRTPRSRTPVFLTAALLAAATTLATSGATSAEPVVYNRDIRPILAENCFACHGPDSAARKADLRLDRREAAVESGAIVPGKPDASAAWQRILSTDHETLMPPPETGKKLTDAQKATLKKWIESGAEYQPHWSFLPIARVEPPAVKQSAWVRNPIDRFVLAQLEAAGLEPAPEADRRTLARRLSLDLTGLPPTPESVEAFVADDSADAYERYVDRLLKSKAWGEHRARYWLDAARYADTHGIHFDNYREMWVYRDWVIDAFNRNLSFDRFTIEQLAGDLLPDATLDQRIASGFNRCNITTNEGGVIGEEYLVLYTRDRTETVSQVWLGLTANCAVCHDHKFDPLTQKQFYSMAAFFNNSTQGAMDGNIKDTPPVLPVPLLEDRPRFDAAQAELADAKRQQDERRRTARGEFDGWLAGLDPAAFGDATPREGLLALVDLKEGEGLALQAVVAGQPKRYEFPGGIGWDAGAVGGKSFQAAAGGVVAFPELGDFEGDKPFSVGVWVKPGANQTGAIVARMDDQADYRGWDLWLQGNRPAMHLINKWQDDALKVVGRKPLAADKWQHVLATYDGSRKASGVKLYVDGQLQETQVEADKLQGTTRTERPLTLAQRSTQSRLEGLRLEQLRLYDRALAPRQVEQLVKSGRAAALVAKPADQRTDAEKNELFDWWLKTIDKAYPAAADRVAALEAEIAAIRGRGTVAHVMQERSEEAMAYVLFRGEYDKRRDPVKPQTPDALPPMPPDLPRNRLGFAQWLLLPEHPLTARVTVNRFWQELFGAGLVRTSGDFGVAGELPSHPELLDWLAIDFRENGWDVKRFYKQVVTSAAYRQAAVQTPLKRERDPANRLISRGPRFRLDGEVIRDYALASSGLLSPKIGGPSVKPYQPEGVWEAVAMIGSNTRDYRPDSGENVYRRSLYTFWKRSAPPASLEIFNAPSREVCTVRRERTNTPLQALVTLNDPQFVEAARALAQVALRDSKGDSKTGFDLLARRLLSRPLRAHEAAVVQQSLEELRQHYAAAPDDARQLLQVGQSPADSSLDPVQLAAWTMLANQLLNLDEVLNK